MPTEFAVRGREVVAQPLEGVTGAKPLNCSEPLVEAGLIISEARRGAVIILVNWAQNIFAIDAEPTMRVTLALTVPLPAGLNVSEATLASCGMLGKCGRHGSRLNATNGMTRFSVDISIADAIILR